MGSAALSNVRFGSSWLSWVGATAGCLDALGVQCDPADVAGHSGYAFRLVIPKDVCVSGPTLFAWESLLPGAWRLGRSTTLLHSPQMNAAQKKSDTAREQCRVAFEAAKREIDAGRPCVINGAYVPEFAIVVGIEGESYQVETFKRMLNEPQPAVKFDEIDAPGGAYVLGFPTAIDVDAPRADRDSIWHAVAIMSEPNNGGEYATGIGAYDAWIKAMNADSTRWFDNAYNAHCWADARRLAATFVDRVAGRNDSITSLRAAHAALGATADSLEQVATLFPFPPATKDAPDAKVRKQAIEALKSAQRADTEALKQLRAAIDAWSEVKS
jgi:hypothetical protein